MEEKNQMNIPNEGYENKQKISDEDLMDHLLDNEEEEVEYDKKNRGVAYEILTWVRDFAIIIIVFFLFTTFVSERTVVEGQSMEPTISEGDWIYINKFIYRFKKPEQFDIIVFAYAGDRDKHYIKRIIGMPGDEVNVVKDKGVYINGELIDPDYGLEVLEFSGNQNYPLVVPEGNYFVLGDNRNNSHDSRSKDVGTVPMKDVVGQSGLRVWPLNHIGLVK